MKKLILILSLACISVPSLAAKFTLGLTANTTTPTVTSNTDTVASGGMGIGGGFLFDFQVKKLPRIELGVLLLERNIKITNSAELDAKFGMLHLPYLIKKQFGKKKVRVELGIGGFYALGNGNITETNKATNATATYTFDDWQIVKTDYGAEATFGIIYALKKSELLFDIRYAMGLKDVSAFEDDVWKFSDMYILFGWRFGK